MRNFTVYPAIDLRSGQVVRLRQGDPNQQTVYSQDPYATAMSWLNEGAKWLHVVNLDGAFGESVTENMKALAKIVDTGAKIQFGGGLRDIDDIQYVLDLGVERVILGTVAVSNPEIIDSSLVIFGSDKIIVGIDSRDGFVKVKGWQEETGFTSLQIAKRLKGQGIERIIFTDISRDGVGTGLNLGATADLANKTGLDVIASGGVNVADDVIDAYEYGLSGAIVGQALYEGNIDLLELLKNIGKINAS